jgi:hypothetical protein
MTHFSSVLGMEPSLAYKACALLLRCTSSLSYTFFWQHWGFELRASCLLVRCSYCTLLLFDSLLQGTGEHWHLRTQLKNAQKYSTVPVSHNYFWKNSTKNFLKTEEYFTSFENFNWITFTVKITLRHRIDIKYGCVYVCVWGVCVCVAEDWGQDLVHAWQVLYHGATSSAHKEFIRNLLPLHSWNVSLLTFLLPRDKHTSNISWELCSTSSLSWPPQWGSLWRAGERRKASWIVQNGTKPAWGVLPGQPRIKTA